MEKNLISISAVIKDGWNLYIDNFQKFVNPILILLAPYVLLFVVQYFEVPGLDALNLIILIVSVVINLWISILLIRLINDILIKKEINPSEESLYQSSVSMIASYFWVGIITAVITILGFILFIIPGIIFAIWYGFSGYVNVLEKENNKGYAALKTSKELVKGRWGKTFLRLVIPGLAIYFVVMVIIIGLMYAITGGNIDMMSYQQSVLLNILSTVIFLVLAPLFISFTNIVYNSLKETRMPTATPETAPTPPEAPLA